MPIAKLNDNKLGKIYATKTTDKSLGVIIYKKLL